MNDSKQPREYSAELYNQMPIKKLVLISRENQDLYEDIYPPLLRLVAKSYPHLCLVEDYMFEEEMKDDKSSSVFGMKHVGSSRKKDTCTPDELNTGSFLDFCSIHRIFVESCTFYRVEIDDRIYYIACYQTAISMDRRQGSSVWR